MPVSLKLHHDHDRHYKFPPFLRKCVPKVIMDNMPPQLVVRVVATVRAGLKPTLYAAVAMAFMAQAGARKQDGHSSTGVEFFKRYSLFKQF